jgi:hypothetical protein
MPIRTRFGALLLGCGLAIPALLALAQPASASTQQAASCGWETIYTASSSYGGTVELQFDTCDQYVRAYGYDLPYGTVCHVSGDCVQSVSKVRVYNENTGDEAGSGTISESSFTTGAIDDAGTESHACVQDGSDVNAGAITWDPQTCTSYY